MKRIITLFFLSLCVYVANAQFSGNGSGTAESPYLITTALNVEEIRNFQGVAGVQFRLMNDIDMSELVEDTYGDAGWSPILDFRGELDGNGHTISGLYINRPTIEKVGFFSEISGAYVHDLIIIYNGDVIGGQYVGGLGAMVNYTGIENKIERCMVKSNNIIGTYYVGGIIGYSAYNQNIKIISINECIVEAYQIEGILNCGGIIGANSNQKDVISNNRVNSTIKIGTDDYYYRNSRVMGGGIVGNLKGSNCNYNLFEGKLVFISPGNYGAFVGGIVGMPEDASNVSANVSICDSIIGNDIVAYYGRIMANRSYLEKDYDSNTDCDSYDLTEINKNRAYNNTVLQRGKYTRKLTTDSRANGLSVGNILLKTANLYKGMEWDMDNVWSIDEGNSYPRLKWEVEKGLSRPTLTVKNNETIIGENDVIPFLAEKITTDLGGGVSYTYYQCIPDEPSIVNTSSRTQQVTVTVTSQDYSHLKWAGIDGQNADMKMSSESRSCQLERGASVQLQLHAVFADQDFGSYSATVNVSCEDYSRTFLITFTNENPNKPVCPTPDIDYSEGKLVFSCDVEGTPEYHVTITDPDVTTLVVEHELKIERIYTIEVFATAEGYQASETTKLILCWIDAKITDSVEGIISEKGIPLKIRMDNGLMTITGVENNILVSAYSVDGVLLDSTTSTSETVTLTIPTSTEVMVLSVGSNSVKISF